MGFFDMIRHVDDQFVDLVEMIMVNRDLQMNERTGVSTYRLIGAPVLTFDLRVEFPAIQHKKLFFRTVVDELLWFISGSTNINDLPKVSKKIWEAWADEDGELGPTYGAILRGDERFGLKDQLAEFIDGLKNNPGSRRHVMSLWQAHVLDQCKLPPCHGTVIQAFSDRMFGKARINEFRPVLHMNMYQRSCDVLVGLPFNIASYALLLMLIAHHTGHIPGELRIYLGDAHIYNYPEHVAFAHQLMHRRYTAASGVSVEIDWKDDISQYTRDDFRLVGYPDDILPVKLPVAV